MTGWGTNLESIIFSSRNIKTGHGETFGAFRVLTENRWDTQMG